MTAYPAERGKRPTSLQLATGLKLIYPSYPKRNIGLLSRKHAFQVRRLQPQGSSTK